MGRKMVLATMNTFTACHKETLESKPLSHPRTAVAYPINLKETTEDRCHSRLPAALSNLSRPGILLNPSRHFLRTTGILAHNSHCHPRIGSQESGINPTG